MLKTSSMQRCWIQFTLMIPAFLDAFLGRPLDMDFDLSLPRLATSSPIPLPMSASSSPQLSSTFVFINCVRSLRLSRRLLSWVRSE